MGQFKGLDALTNTMNFEHAKEVVGNWLSAATQSQEMIVCATFDVDYLSEINEQHGWAAGDEVLRQLSAICQQYSDLVTRTDDQMSVVWKGCTVEAGVSRAAQLFREIQASPIFYNGEQILVSVSMGITHNHEGEVTSFQELVTTTLTAMTKCKDRGRNRFIMDVAPYM